MKITLIISAHKDRGFLDECILSCKKQTFDDYEIILSSDGNHDLYAYAQKHDLKFIMTHKGNHATALNNAVSVSSGEWIKECHDDDLLTENCLTDLWDATGDNDLIYANAINFNKKGKINEYKSPAPFKPLLLMPVITCPIHAATIMFRKEAFKEVGGFDPNVPCSEEYEFYINLLANGYKFGYCDSVVAWYRKHEDSLTFNYTKIMRHEIGQYILQKHKAYLKTV